MRARRATTVPHPSHGHVADRPTPIETNAAARLQARACRSSHLRDTSRECRGNLPGIVVAEGSRGGRIMKHLTVVGVLMCGLMSACAAPVETSANAPTRSGLEI